MASTQTRPRALETRRRLLAAAGAAFAERGFAATTTRDIAAAVGMSPAAVYVHHGSKEELLHRIALDGHLRTQQLIRDAIAGADTPTAQLAAFMRAFATFHTEQHTVARVINYELDALNPEHLEEIQALRRAIRRDVQSIVDAGIAAGDFRTSDARMAAMALLSLGIDIARWYPVDASWPPDRIASFYAETALRIVDARQEET